MLTGPPPKFHETRDILIEGGAVDWSMTLGIVGAATGLGGLLLGWLGWARSGEALHETRRSPVREAQHSLLARISEWADGLPNLCEAINSDVQQSPPNPEKLRSQAEQLRTLVRQMTDPVIVDEQLANELAHLREVVIPSSTGDMPVGLADSMDRFAELAEQIEEAKDRPGDSKGVRDELVRLGERRQGTLEPLRLRNGAALESAKKIRLRLREIDRDGLGNFPSAAELGRGRRES